MQLSPEQSHLLFYEIAMAIGGSLDLQTMLRESVFTYLKKLNCSAGGVLMLKESDGCYDYEPVFSIPRCFHNHAVYQSILSRIPHRADSLELSGFLAALPASGSILGSDHFYLMKLPDFGLIYFNKRDEDFDAYTIKSLIPLNNKLARACQSCLQKEALQRSENKYRSIFDNAAAGIFQCSQEGRITHCNPAFPRILGYADSSDTCRMSFDKTLFVHPEQYDAVMSRIQDSDRVAGFQAEVYRQDGSVAAILLNCHGLRDRHGRILSYEGMIEDITEKAQHEKMRMEKEAAESANRSKSEFLANMSHEIRTPMNAILGFCDVLAEEGLNEEQSNYLSIIRKSGQNLLCIINDILDFSKIEAGRMTIEITDFALQDLLQTVMALMEPRAAEKGLQLKLSCSTDTVPKTIATDPLRLQQCLINLLGNAVKFTEKGSVCLTVFGRPCGTGNQIVFEVKDTGIGIATDKQKSIFNPFTQADASTTRKFGGTGLGLAITSQLIQLMGGTIQVSSAPAAGSTFTICLPIEPAHGCRHHPREQETVQVMQTGPAAESTLSGSILIAEDNKTNQSLIQTILSRWGLSTDIVENGQLAVEYAARNRYDVILMDIQMPVMNGLEATQRIRNQSATIPIIALTANAMEGDRQKCLEAGCNEYLTKPILRDKLLAVLSRYLCKSSVFNSDSCPSASS
jgi:PAS domain S-box-containing protein